MEIISIIAEYNPLHNGHAFQIKKARSQLGENSAVIALMSGCFCQRGEPALLDKWSRTRMALASGVDLVLELPFAYACASAERFARGAVLSLVGTGLDSWLCFGSESGDLAQLNQLAGQLAHETAAFKAALRQRLDQGLSFPAARSQALLATGNEPGLVSLLDQPNNILAVEYLKALLHSKADKIKPLPIKRQGQAFHTQELPAGSNENPSASAIRLALKRRLAGQMDLAGLLDDLAGLMPSSALAELLAACQAGPGPLLAEDLASFYLVALRGADTVDLAKIAGMGEGLSRRLQAAAARPAADSRDKLAVLLADTATRRFTRTRIQRALVAMIVGLRQADLDLFDAHGGPAYLRVLGFSRRGRYVLKLMRRLASLPIISKASDFLEYSDQPALQRLARLDLAATDIWQLAGQSSIGLDFDTPVIMR